MAIQDLQPFVMKNAIVQLGENDFAMAVNSATITPAGGITPYKGLKPAAVWNFPQAVTWSLDLSYAQDWGDELSLSRYLFDHIGQIVPCTVNVDDADPAGSIGTTSWVGEVAITAGAVGGAVDAVAVADVSLGWQGQPVPTFTAATPTP